MSIDSVKILSNSTTKVYIDLEQVKTVKWSRDLGQRITNARKQKDKMTLNSLSQELSRHGVSCSDGNLSSIETGKHDSVGLDLLMAICYVLDLDLSTFLSLVSLAE